MTCDMNVSDKMMKNIVNTDLKFLSLKMQTCQRLTDLQKKETGLSKDSSLQVAEALKRSLVITRAKMPQETLCKAAEGFHSRLKHVIQASGDILNEI